MQGYSGGWGFYSASGMRNPLNGGRYCLLLELGLWNHEAAAVLWVSKPWRRGVALGEDNSLTCRGE
jgi:hypothetical protein